MKKLGFALLVLALLLGAVAAMNLMQASRLQPNLQLVILAESGRPAANILLRMMQPSIPFLDGRRGEPERDAATVDEGLIVFSRVGHTILGFVRWVDAGTLSGHVSVFWLLPKIYRHLATELR